MSFLLTSLILCLFQTQGPELSLKGSESAYNEAMHLIDVRGKYLDGAEILESIADAHDVIYFPGQSSWILAQAARAFTLAGKPELASMDLDLIRAASRGTQFEESVQGLLLSFANQGVGLNQEFLAHIHQSLWKEHLRKELHADFGADLLPYFRYLLSNVDNEVSLSDRSGALQISFSILNQESVEWMTEFLLTEPLVSKKTLGRVIPESNWTLYPFQNSEARSALAEVLLNLSYAVDEEELNAVLYNLIAILEWRNSLNDPAKDAPTTDKVHSRIILILEQGHFGNNHKALEHILELPSENYGGLMPLSVKIANSEQLELGHKMRWALVNNKFASTYIKEWAKEGGEENMLRLCLATNDLSKDLFRLGNRSQNLNLIAWALTELDSENPKFSLPDSLKTRSPDEQELEILSGMTASKNPVIRFFAAHTLLRNGKQKEAVAFLLELGEDSAWASYFLNYWARSNYNHYLVLPESMKILAPLARKGPLAKEVRLLLEVHGGPIMTKKLWGELDLKPSGTVLEMFNEKAIDTNDFDGLLWIMLKSDPSFSAASFAASVFSERDPKGYLAAIPQLKKAGRRWDYFSAEQNAWEKGATNFGSPFFQGTEELFEEFIPVLLERHPISNLFQSMLTHAPDAALDFFSKHLEEENMVDSLSKYTRVLRIDNLQSPAKAVQFSIALLRAGHEDILLRNNPFFGALLDPKLEATETFFSIFWASNPPVADLSQKFLHTTISDTKLRSRFHNEMSQLLSVEAWAGQTSQEYEAVGAVDEILEDLFLAIEDTPAPKNLAKFLLTISSVDDPRVVEILMRHLEDSRPLVHKAAATALDNLRASRIRKQEWEAWVSDNGATSPTAALLNDLQDPEKEIRLAAIASLGTLRSTEALPALVNLLRDSDEKIKDAARKALARINAEPVPPEEIVEDPFEPKEPKK